MANHFRAMGFDVHSEPTYRQFVEQIMKYGTDVAFNGGESTRWTLDCGIDHWAQTRALPPTATVSAPEEFVGTALHHLGQTRVRATIQAVLTLPLEFNHTTRLPADAMLEGRLRLACPGNGGKQASLWVDAVDYAQNDAHYTVGTEHEFQLTAFADHVEHLSDGAGGQLPTAAPQLGADRGYRTEAILEGTILALEPKENGDTDAPYMHAQLDCAGVQLELVAASLPATIAAGARVRAVVTITALRITTNASP
jgi:hypothetical protein